MMRVSWLRLTAVILCLLLPLSVNAQFNNQRFGFWTSAPSSAATTTFDPANAGTGIVLSNGNLTATAVGGGGTNYTVVRSVASHSSGKYYAEFAIVGNGGNDFFISVGITTSGASLFATTGLGQDANLSLGTFGASTQYFINNGNSGTTTAYTTSNVVDIALDAGGQLVWQRVNGGNWNGSALANPALGVGGQSISAITGPYYAAVSGFLNGTNPAITGNFGGSSYNSTPPAGFGNW